VKAYLIDPEQKSITEMFYDDSNYRNIGKLIDADLFDVVRFADTHDVIYVDDNGLSADKRFFTVKGYPSPLAGKGLVLGTNYAGESMAPETTIEGLEQIITFISDHAAITMAVEADEAAVRNKAENTIYIPVADIIQSRAYTDPSE